MTFHVVNTDERRAPVCWSQRIDGKIVGLRVIIGEVIGGRYQSTESTSPNSC